MVAADIAKHMCDFIAHRDVSPALVGHIEGLLDTFDGTDWHEELGFAVVLYEPWGDDGDGDTGYFYTVAQLSRLFAAALPFLDAESQEPL